MTRVGFTHTQSAILDILSDGLRHRKEELATCLPDELSAIDNLKFHLSNIRKVIRPRGEDIICEWYQRIRYYRHVRLLSNPYRG